MSEERRPWEPPEHWRREVEELLKTASQTYLDRRADDLANLHGWREPKWQYIHWDPREVAKMIADTKAVEEFLKTAPEVYTNRRHNLYHDDFWQKWRPYWYENDWDPERVRNMAQWCVEMADPFSERGLRFDAFTQALLSGDGEVTHTVKATGEVIGRWRVNSSPADSAPSN